MGSRGGEERLLGRKVVLGSAPSGDGAEVEITREVSKAE